MRKSNHDVARAFFAGVSNGELPDWVLAPDLTVWSTTSGHGTTKQGYETGVKLLASVTNGGLTYTIDSLTSEEDRIAAEVQGKGTLANGEPFHMHYLFLFRVKDGRISSIVEHINPILVGEKIAPLMREAMSKTQR